jgi:hypothetical protein
MFEQGALSLHTFDFSAHALEFLLDGEHVLELAGGENRG